MIIKNNYLEKTIEQINLESEKIDILMYLIRPSYKVSSEGIVYLYEALQNAVNRGVKIRIITDFRDTIEQLNLIGAEVKLSRSSRRMHAKAVIFSDSAIVGSHNWSKMGLQHNDEISVLTKDYEEIQELNKIFEEIWGDS